MNFMPMRLFSLAATAALSLSLTFTPTVAQQQTAQTTAEASAPVRTEPFATSHRDAIAKIRGRLVTGVECKDPTANLWLRSGAKTIFDGSYDWHSCIAAHWTGLSMGRLLGDEALCKQFVARLQVADLAAELARLGAESSEPTNANRRARSGVAMYRPYVDAWLVLLLAELDEHQGVDKAAVRALRSQAEQGLLQQLEAGAFPETPASTDRPHGAVSGAYRSWLFGYLALRLAKPTDDATRARLDALKLAKLDPVRAQIAANASASSRDFLDPVALSSLVDCLDSNLALAPTARTFRELPTTRPALRDIHPLGAAISETWPFALAASWHEPSRAAFTSRMDQILAREDLWAEDFATSSHWLPQFLWFGMRLELLAAERKEAGAAPTAEAAAKPKPKPKMTPMPKPGTPAPWFDMTDRDGKPVTLEQFAGKVVVLDFWATWCGPCKQAMPHLQEIAKTYADQGVVVVASCTNDERAKFEAWVDANRTGLPDILFAHDPKERADDRGSLKNFGVMMLPVTVVIDREGKIAKTLGGYMPGEVLVDAALAKAGITVPAETLEKAAKDEEARKARAKAAQPATPKKAEAKPAGSGN